MEEIKLWCLEKDSDGTICAKNLDATNQTDRENLLESILVKNPELLMPDLVLVGRQTPTEGGPLDLLGITEDGNLVVFELKRGKLTRDAVAQVIDYASYLASMDEDSLCAHISERSGSGGIERIDNFNEWYQSEYPNSEGLGQPPRMALVGLGIDDRARRMIEFMAASGLSISLFTFQAFEKGGQMFLARQMEMREKPQPPAHGPTKNENLEALRALAQKVRCQPLLDEIASFFRSETHSYEWPLRGGYSYSLVEKTEKGTGSLRVYFRLIIGEELPGEVEFLVVDRAVRAAGAYWKDFVKDNGNRFKERKGNFACRFKSSAEFKDMMPVLKELLAQIIQGWQQKTEADESDGESSDNN